MEIYLKTGGVSIGYDPPDKVLIVRWTAAPSSGEFRKEMNAVIEALTHFNTGLVVFNTTALGDLPEADQEWTARDWYNRAIQVGYARVAFVMSPDFFARLSVEETTNRNIKRIPTAYFYNMESALKWIRQSQQDSGRYSFRQ